MDMGNGQVSQLGPASNGASRKIQVFTPLTYNGTVTHNNKVVKYSCKLMPLPGKFLPNGYPKTLSEAFISRIIEKAQMRMPQLFERASHKHSVTDSLETTVNGQDYKLDYNYLLE